MSEYMEKHSVSRLIGAPPGYVGFDQGGLLTDAIGQNPHCVLLLDEIEKAHPDLFSLLLQVMDYGKLTDHNGRSVDFRSVMLVMTTNAGASEASEKSIGFKGTLNASASLEAIKRLFTPEFRNRLDGIVPFSPLSSSVMHGIVGKFLREFETQLETRKVSLSVSSAAKDWLATRGYDKAMGARPLRRAIQRYIEDPLADFVLRAELPAGGTVMVDKNHTPEDGEPEVSLSIIQPKVPAAVGGGDAPAELEAGSDAPSSTRGGVRAAHGSPSHVPAPGCDGFLARRRPDRQGCGPWMPTA